MISIIYKKIKKILYAYYILYYIFSVCSIKHNEKDIKISLSLSLSLSVRDNSEILYLNDV